MGSEPDFLQLFVPQGLDGIDPGGLHRGNAARSERDHCQEECRRTHGHRVVAQVDAQAAVAKAVADSVASGVLPKSQAEDLVIVCGVFIHPAAEDNKKIYQYNYDATKQAIANAMSGKPTADEMVAGKDKAEHPFKGF